MAESIVTLRVEARNAISSLNKTSQATKTLSRNANSATKSLAATSTAARGLGSALATSLGPLLTLGAAVATVSNAIGTFTARERDVAILTQGLQNLGAGTAELNKLEEAANRLGNQTLFNQEEFTRGFNLLTSFRNIGVDSYSRVAQAAADIAQVNQVDVSTSFMQLAKALQDPERNLSNLNRSGIAFTKQQTEVIKQLMKTNKTAEAHAMILSIVEESYNKLAQAAAEGFAGEVDSLGEAFRDFSETLGKALEPALIAATKGLTALITAADNLFKSPLGQTAGVFTAIALAAKGVAIALPLVSAGLIKVAAAGGIATIALNAIPFVAIATGVGLLTTGFFKLNAEKKEFNNLLNEGKEEEVTQALRDQAKAVGELTRQHEEAKGRDKKALSRKLKEAELELKMLEGRLQTLKSDKKIEEAANKIVELKETEIALQKDQLATNFLFNESLGQTNFLVDGLSLGANIFNEELMNAKSETELLNERFREIGQAIEQGLVSNLTDAVMGTQTLGQAAINVLDNLKRKLVEVAIQKAVSGIGGFLGGMFGGGGGGGLVPFIPSLGGAGFANGGRPPVGKASIVGERGPELFVPSTAGTIIPNNQLGGGSTNNIVVNVNMEGDINAQGDQEDGRQLGTLIAAAVQGEIIRQQRPGGLLTR